MGLPTGADSPMIRPMTEWAHDLSGRFIVFDGPDGSGKTTQFHRFVAWCEAKGVAVQPVREPGGTSIGEQVRIPMPSAPPPLHERRRFFDRLEQDDQEGTLSCSGGHEGGTANQLP